MLHMLAVTLEEVTESRSLIVRACGRLVTVKVERHTSHQEYVCFM
jgi:hypothetical protein